MTGMEAAKGQSRHRWVGEAMAVICQRQPLRNNPRNSAAELVMSDYIISVTGGAAATEPPADGNTTLCSNDHLEPTGYLKRNDQQE